MIHAGGRISETIAVTTYGLGLLFVFGASATYHGLKSSSIWPRKIDHLAIYVMIAGSYTPLCVLILPKAVGIPMLVAQWLLAIAGIGLNLFLGGGPTPLRISIYLIMGWMAMFAFRPLLDGLTYTQLQLLVWGGVTYTIGTIIYATNWPSLWPPKFRAHDLWHVFVLIASCLHFGFVQCIIK